MAEPENNSEKSRRVGGARPGAGRPKGSANRKTREVADRAAAAGITPLEVMLEAMNKLRDAGDLAKAAAVAKDAAPYMHARLSAVEVDGVTAPAPALNIDPVTLTAIMKRLSEEI